MPSYILHSQEVITDFTFNPTITIKYHQSQISSQALGTKSQISVLDTISLPFLDDFSKDNIYPDASLWLDSNAFINRDYPITPPTLGVATLDGASKTGCPYDTIITGAGSYPADTLTSKPINLSSLPSDSSVVLSFFWQAKGRGNDPENSDSLILQFRNPSDSNNTTAWRNIWYKNGYNPSSSDTTFRLVMIPRSEERRVGKECRL